MAGNTQSKSSSGALNYIVGVILLLVGIAVEFMFWKVAPAWYHIIFVLALIPMTILGGRIRRPN